MTSYFQPRDVACYAFSNVNLNVPSAVQTALALNAERYDTDAMHDNAVNNTRITIPVTGRYHVGGEIVYAVQAGGAQRDASVRLNGATFIAIQRPVDTGGFGATAPVVQVSADYDFVAGDYIELMAYQDSGIAINAINFASMPALWTHLITAT